MKKIILIAYLSFIVISLNAQSLDYKLSNVYVNENVTTHIFAGDPISYVDISTDKIVGNQPEKTFIRIKPLNSDSLQNNEFLGIVTIVSQRFKSQYNVFYKKDKFEATTDYEIPEIEKESYLNPKYNMSTEDMYQYAWSMINSTNSFYDVSTKKQRLKIRLNNIYTLEDYFFLDISLENYTNIKFDFEEIRLFLEDKKVTKAKNFQTLEIKPVLNLNKPKSFKKNYRTVLVINKMTFPDEKQLLIEVSEKQISGRTITLKIDYSDVLHADIFVKK